MLIEEFLLDFSALCFYTMAFGLPVAAVGVSLWSVRRFLRRRARRRAASYAPRRETYRNRNAARENEREFYVVIRQGYRLRERAGARRNSRRTRSTRRSSRAAGHVVT